MKLDEWVIKERIAAINEPPKLDEIRAAEDELLKTIASLDAQDLIIARIEDDRAGSGGWVIKVYGKEIEESFDETEENEEEEEH